MIPVAFALLIAYTELRLMFAKPNEPPEPEPPHHYEIELSPAEYRLALACLKASVVGQVYERKRVIEAFEMAYIYDGRPARTRLPWVLLAREAKRRHCSEADAIYDLSRKPTKGEK